MCWWYISWCVRLQLLVHHYTYVGVIIIAICVREARVRQPPLRLIEVIKLTHRNIQAYSKLILYNTQQSIPDPPYTLHKIHYSPINNAKSSAFSVFYSTCVSWNIRNIRNTLYRFFYIFSNPHKHVQNIFSYLFDCEL